MDWGYRSYGEKGYVGTELVYDVGFFVVVNWNDEQIKNKFQDNVKMGSVY